jgi:hypothetical protein
MKQVLFLNYEQPKFCGNCGKNFIDGATFCAYCGTPIPVIDADHTKNLKSTITTPFMQPSEYKRSISDYHSIGEQDRVLLNPSLPFIQHFRGVLLTPQTEMPQIVNRLPNIIHPLFIVLICGILSAISSFILLSNSFIIFYRNFSRNVHPSSFILYNSLLNCDNIFYFLACKRISTLDYSITDFIKYSST